MITLFEALPFHFNRLLIGYQSGKSYYKSPLRLRLAGRNKKKKYIFLLPILVLFY